MNLVTFHGIESQEGILAHVAEQNELGYRLIQVLHFSGSTHIFFWEKAR